MFGARKKPGQQSNQVPYEVYETVHEPEARRRRWFIRLGAALLVVTALIFGGVQLQRTLQEPNDSAGNRAAQNDGQSGGPNNGATPENQETPPPQSGQNAQPPQSGQGSPSTPGSVMQSPQQNTPLPASGSSSEDESQPNPAQNNTTVTKPE